MFPPNLVEACTKQVGCIFAFVNVCNIFHMNIIMVEFRTYAK